MILKLLTNKLSVGIIAITLILGLSWNNYQIRSDANRLKSNYEVVIGQKEDQLNLNRSEFKDYVNNNEQIKRVLRDSLDIRNRQVKEIKSATSKTKVIIKVQNRDSVVYVTDSTGLEKQIKYHAFKYRDQWNMIDGLCAPDTTMIKIKVTDNLTMVEFWYKERKFFVARWFEKRKVKTEIIGENPNASYTVTREIKTLSVIFDGIVSGWAENTRANRLR